MNTRFVFNGLVVLALTCPVVAHAQVGGGVKVGVNLATLSGFNNPTTTQRVGLTIGAFLTARVAPLVAIQPEVLFSMQGSKLHFAASPPIVASDATAKLDYVQVPVLLRFGNSGKSAASLFGVAGPSFGILARRQGVTDTLKRMDLGVVVGGGVTLSRLLLEGRYTFGLTDFNSGSTIYKNRVLSLLVGVQF